MNDQSMNFGQMITPRNYKTESVNRQETGISRWKIQAPRPITWQPRRAARGGRAHFDWQLPCRLSHNHRL